MRIGYVTAAWGLLFAIVHAYWAAGGEAGMNGEPADTLGAQLYIGFVAALGLVAAGVGIGLAERGNPPLVDRVLVLLARAGGAALLIGAAVGTGRWVADGSLNGDGAEGVAITLYFLLGGLLFSLLGWRCRRVGRRWITSRSPSETRSARAASTRPTSASAPSPRDATRVAS
jgi:hypothetical protein